MKSKKIANIVFYNFYEGSKEVRQACVFYNDGTIENCSFDEGIDYTLDLLREQKVTSKELSSIINNRNIHVMSGTELNKNFQKFIVKENNNEKEEDIITEEVISTPEEKLNDKDLSAYESLAKTDYEEEEKDNKIEDTKDNSNKNDSTKDESKKKKSNFNTKVVNFFDKDKKVEDKPLKVADEIKYKSKRKKDKFSTKVKNFFHRTRVKATAVVLSVVVALTGGLFLGKNESKIGKFLNNTFTKNSTNKTNNGDNLIYGDNDYYDNYSYSDLLKVNTNEAQKSAMKKIHRAFAKFNNKFANSHIEEGKNIKAALSWTEMNALHQAYNSYSTEEIKAIFNGSAINANEFSQAYRNANLQLMGAHVIETRQNPVDLSVLINSEEGKDFYRKYHEMFLQIKEAEGQDKIDKVNAWRQALLEDFPISDDVREIGIAHSDKRIVDQYKLSIVPMVSAVEIMYQNLATDNTLSEKTVDYFNDTGLCNLADDAFERIERITETATEDNTEPLYVQYENAIVSELEEENNYNIEDSYRELTNLEAFQNAVNDHNHDGLSSSLSGNASSEVYTQTHTTTTTETKTKTEKFKTSDEKEAIKKSSKKAVDDAKKKVDQDIDAANKKAKEDGEKEAENNRKKIQDDEDQKAKDIQDKIAKDDQDLQDDIDKANDQINNNNSDTDTSNDDPVNESDFGDHNVDFDDDYSDENGNLDSSVKDLTTDSSKDQSNEPLPDPNATGKTFEETYPKTSVDPEYVPETSAVETTSYETSGISSQADSIITYEEPAVETIDYAEAPVSNEELADMLVEDMANNPEAEYTEGYQYVLR